MISKEEVKEWWERKIDNYIKNYARWNKLSLAEAQAKFFTETHEKFFESIPQAFKKLLKICS
jgi:DNA polymerase III delta subunit